MTHAVRALVLVWFVALPFAACGGSTSLDGGGGGDAGPSYDACQLPSECVVRPASCCGQCGAATREDIVTLNKDQAAAYQSATCGDSWGCPACYMVQDSRLVATCASAKCKLVDLATHSSTTCASDGDCRVRTNACCECGGPVDQAHLVAINASKESDFSATVCDPGMGCPECAPTYPAEATAVCNAGHCEVTWAVY